MRVQETLLTPVRSTLRSSMRKGYYSQRDAVVKGDGRLAAIRARDFRPNRKCPGEWSFRNTRPTGGDCSIFTGRVDDCVIRRSDDVQSRVSFDPDPARRRSCPPPQPLLSNRAAAPAHQPGRGRVYDSIADAYGDTPLVRLNRLPGLNGVKATILAKLEYFNPVSSVKDRIGVAMIDAMEREGIIKPGHHPDRADLRQHRHRAGLRGRRQGLPADAGDAGIDVDRAPQDAGVSRRRAGADRSRQGHEGRDRQGRGADRLDPERGHAAAVQEPRQSRGPPPHHRRGNLERHRRRASTSSSPASAPAAPSPASARC